MKHVRKQASKEVDVARPGGDARGEHEPASESPMLAPRTRSKTGGRVKKSLEDKLKLGQARSQISLWCDDTTVDEELAALYLGISVKKLQELRAPPKEAKDKQRVAGPPFIKIFDPGATGQNQPVQYKLGDLREYQKHIKATDTFDAAVKAGLAGWMTIRQPFFAPPEDLKGITIVADAWDMNDPLREDRFADLVSGNVQVIWLTPAEASTIRWTNVEKHRAFAALGLKWLREEIGATEASISATEIASATAEIGARERSGKRVRYPMNPGGAPKQDGNGKE